MEIRTNIHIMSDLLRYVIDNEWSGEFNTSCGCHPEYVSSCQECENFKYVPSNYKKKQLEDLTHKNKCRLYSLIKEARAVIEAENEMRFKNDEELIDSY